MKFENYNSFLENEPSKGLYILEDFMDSDFIKSITGKKNLIKDKDYIVLPVEEDIFDKGYCFTILLNNVDPEFIKLIDDSYDEYHKYYKIFIEYVESNGYSMPTIAFERNNGLSFSMRIYSKK